uniref:Uncharacterized protein n=1 Tax=Arion vulgaris TaxID=1028688 RepID=A0A0B7BN46_9EUPU
MHAVEKHATFPVIIALITNFASVGFRLGAIADKVPKSIPIDPKFENPQRA